MGDARIQETGARNLETHEAQQQKQALVRQRPDHQQQSGTGKPSTYASAQCNYGYMYIQNIYMKLLIC